MRPLSIFLCALALSAVSVGQSNYATVSGMVKDSQSLPVAHATLEFRSLSTGATRTVTTDESGAFYAPALFPNDYKLTTTASGFATVELTLHLEVGQQLAIDIPLKIGTVKEGV